jgi:hypothetical protein
MKFISLLCVLSLLLGCAKDNSDDSHYPYPTYETNNKLTQELANASLTCATKECSSNLKDFESVGRVGMVVQGSLTGMRYRIGLCTGFLYGSNDIVALNSHCISDSMWENRHNCGDYLAIKFPETPGHPSEIRTCKEIIYRHKLGQDRESMVDQDYAFFRINPVDRIVLPLATSPTGNNQYITVRKINPLESKASLGGQLDYAHCVTLTGSLLNVNFNGEWDKTGLGVKSDYLNRSCIIIQGNSGSPVLNVRNEVIGFAQSYAEEKLLSILQSSQVQESFSKEMKIDITLQMAICARSPKNISAENTVCTSKATAPVSDEQLMYFNFVNSKSITDYVEKLKVETLKQYPAFFQYDLVKNQDRHSYTIQPKCLLNPKKWDQNGIETATSLFSAGSTPKLVKTMLRPVAFDLNIKAKYDQNLKLESKLLSHTSHQGRFITHFSGSSISKIYRARPVGLYFSEDSLEPITGINWCP